MHGVGKTNKLRISSLTVAFCRKLAQKYKKKKWKFVNRAFSRFINHSTSAQDTNWLQKFLIWRFSRSQDGFRYLKIKDQNTLASSSYLLASGQSFVCEAPRKVDGQCSSIKGIARPIYLRQFRNIVVSPYSSAFIAGDSAYVPNQYFVNKKTSASDRRMLLWQSEDGHGLTYYDNTSHLEKGVMVFGAGIENWYHWLIEYLPLVHLSKQLPSDFDDYPLLLPANILKIAQFKQSLDLVSTDRAVKPLEGTYYCIESLLQVDKLVTEPIFMRPGETLSKDDYAFRPSSLMEYRDTILSSAQHECAVEPTSAHQKIFLARSNNSRPYNQNEIIDIVGQYDFSIVFPETLSFQQQVELYSNARFLVGPSGAAFANSLFCSKGTRMLSWLLPQYAGFCSFSNIAYTIGAELRYIFVEPTHEVKNPVDAFNASYRVNPMEFEKALRTMLFSETW